MEHILPDLQQIRAQSTRAHRRAQVAESRVIKLEAALPLLKQTETLRSNLLDLYQAVLTSNDHVLLESPALANALTALKSAYPGGLPSVSKSVPLLELPPLSKLLDNDLFHRAHAFADQMHGSINQVRKYTGEPYIRHPEAVARLVSTVPHTPEMLAAAVLHDVVEDTPATIEMVYELFGATVGAMVRDLTDVSRPEDGNRAVRKNKDRKSLLTASAGAKTVRLCDLIHNAQSLLEHDKNFAVVYIGEKEKMLPLLEGGDVTLLAMAKEIVVNAKAQLRLERDSVAKLVEELSSVGKPAKNPANLGRVKP